jgi:hypothetical protein
MEEICSSETSVLTRATQHHIPEDDILHSHYHGNLKSHNLIFVLYLLKVYRLQIKWDYKTTVFVLKEGHNLRPQRISVLFDTIELVLSQWMDFVHEINCFRYYVWFGLLIMLWGQVNLQLSIDQLTDSCVGNLLVLSQHMMFHLLVQPYQ